MKQPAIANEAPGKNEVARVLHRIDDKSGLLLTGANHPQHVSRVNYPVSVPSLLVRTLPTQRFRHGTRRNHNFQLPLGARRWLSHWDESSYHGMTFASFQWRCCFLLAQCHKSGNLSVTLKTVSCLRFLFVDPHAIEPLLYCCLFLPPN